VLTPSDKKNVRFCGTPLYMAPNVILKNPHDRKHYIFLKLQLIYFSSEVRYLVFGSCLLPTDV
jgi:serine/threonine protein kinase